MDEALKVLAKGKPINTVAAVAQAGLESAWGASLLAREANNLFGIKAGRSWKGDTLELRTSEFGPNGWHFITVRWRRYPSWSACFEDYVNIINGLSWYKDCLPHADPPLGDGDVDLWVAGLLPKKGEPGWATDPAYGDKVRSAANVVRQVLRNLGFSAPKPA
jgi:flagellar protein FlgJ